MIRRFLFRGDHHVLTMQGSIWLSLAFLASLAVLACALPSADAAVNPILLTTVTALLVGFSGFVVFRCARRQSPPKSDLAECSGSTEIPLPHAA